MGDRREHPRLAVALEGQYRAEGSVLGRRATLTDLSLSSVAFIAGEPLEPGVRLDYLRFTLGEGPFVYTLRPACEVVRCSPRAGTGRDNDYLIAASFHDLSSADRERIADHVAAGLARSDDYNPRIDLEKPVAVRFERFHDFVSEVSKNLSRTGMFIESEESRPVGSRFEFVLQLGDDFTLVQGRAEVVWTRVKSEGPELPPGMGVRFKSLDKTSENVLRRLIGERTQLAGPRALAPEPVSSTAAAAIEIDGDEPAPS